MPLWLTLSKETRLHLVKIFNIPQTGVKEVRDQDVVSDGHTNDNLTAISKEKMAEYTGSPLTESFNRLWEITLAKVKFELNPPPVDLSSLQTSSETTGTSTTSFCDTCDAKGPIKHKKTCPKFK